MSEGNPVPQLQIERVTEGAQMYLSDGSVCRVGLAYLATARGWKAGDPVEIVTEGHMTHDKTITNLRTGESIRAMRSSSLEGTGFDHFMNPAQS